MLAYSAFRSDEEGRDEWSIEIDGGAPPPASAVSSLPGPSGVARRDQHDRREVAPIAADITGQQGDPFDHRMGADEEIRQHTRLGAAPRTIGLERFAGQKQGRARDFFDLDLCRGEDCLDLIDSLEAD
jgi:hypothetical protein